MNENELRILSKSYAPIIKSLIEKDAKFFMFKENIKWGFNYGEESEVMAAVGNALKKLCDDGIIEKHGGGRSTFYSPKD